MVPGRPAGLPAAARRRRARRARARPRRPVEAPLADGDRRPPTPAEPPAPAADAAADDRRRPGSRRVTPPRRPAGDGPPRPAQPRARRRPRAGAPARRRPPGRRPRARRPAAARAAAPGRPPPRRRAAPAGRPPPPPRRPAPVALGRPARACSGGLLAVLSCSALIGGRLVWLQGFQAEAYAAEASKQRLRTVTLPAPRGTITDRSGQALALSVDARAVYGEPRTIAKAVCQPDDDDALRRRRRSPRALAPVLDLPRRRARGEADPPRRRRQDLLADRPDRLHGLRLPRPRARARGRQRGRASCGLVGIGTIAEPKRVAARRRASPPTSSASPTVEGGGRRRRRARLGRRAGRQGRQARPPRSTAAAASSRPATPQQVEPVARPRRAADDRPRPAVVRPGGAGRASRARPTPRAARAVVMDVQTGEVLALASAPTFDANDPGAAPTPQLRGNRADQRRLRARQRRQGHHRRGRARGRASSRRTPC